MMQSLIGKLLAVGIVLAATGCATTERSTALETPKVQAAAAPYAGKRVSVSLGNFENKSPYLRGIFSDGVDRIGNQARTILTSHLQLSGRFGVLDRENLEQSKFEAGVKSQAQQLRGADFLVTGAVTEFGRKEVGDHQLFGILGRGKEQVAYAKVTLNVVNTQTSEVVFSAQGAGEYGLSSREIVGFGSTAGYDSTLSGKVLDLAIRQAVDGLAKGIDTGTLRN